LCYVFYFCKLSYHIFGNDVVFLCMQIWMWERLPVGRPQTLRHPPEWHDHGDPELRPTVAHLYEGATGPYALKRFSYILYMNEIDALLPEFVSIPSS